MTETDREEGDGHGDGDKRYIEVFATIREAIHALAFVAVVVASALPLYFLARIFTPFAGQATEVGVNFNVGLAVPSGLTAALVAALERLRRRGKHVDELKRLVRELQQENSDCALKNWNQTGSMGWRKGTREHSDGQLPARCSRRSDTRQFDRPRGHSSHRGSTDVPGPLPP